ncbi:MAG: 2-amino-4-hydroxy-6-hydroxymethyldihydropteridine diphosphokinase [Muribaculaceae bacterium]|nr:2-amino-4-hydroxy-6-hydroxymethyldihydropteridine diphosphokinase [Muribaculaceae bacterium]
MAFRVHINIGSNKGDRHSAIERAVALVAESPDITLEALSDPVTSPPWGFDSTHPFLNVGAELTTTLLPLTLLDRLQSIERSISPDSHRAPDGIRYVDRVIDIDIIAIDTVDSEIAQTMEYGAGTPLVIEHPRLRVPHPLMHLRTFVLTPMCQLRGSWRHPLFGLTPAEMIIHFC